MDDSCVLPMTDNNCKKCGSQLLLGKGKLNIGWCPVCSGVVVESVDESKRQLISEIKGAASRIHQLLSDYEKESLLISAYITRESELHSDVPDYFYFMGISELLNLIDSSKKLGNKPAVWNEKEVQELYHLAASTNRNKKFISLLQNGWIRFIRIKQSEMKIYCYDLENSLKVNEVVQSDLDGDSLVSVLKFTYQWKEIMENLKMNGILSKNEAHFGRYNPAKVPFLDEFWSSIGTKVILEQSTGDRNLLEFPDLKNSLDLIKYLEEIALEYSFDYSLDKNNMGRVISFEIRPITLIQLYELFSKRGVELAIVDPFLRRIISRKVKGFSLLLLTSKGLFVGPKTLLLASKFLKAKYFREYLDQTLDVGKEFEDLVVMELEKYGLSVRQPNDKNKKMINIVDDTNKPTLEIDVIAHKKGEIYLIECKQVVFSTDFMVHNRKSHIERVLSAEPEKMKKRVAFLSSNFKKFGFDKNKVHFLEQIYVTFNAEPIDKFHGIRIVPFRELGRFNVSSKGGIVRFFTVSELLTNLPDHQYALSKMNLEKNENACMICGGEPAKQLLMNGYPSQLCDDCIDIQNEMFDSTTEDVS